MPSARRLALLLVLLPFAQANAHDTLPQQWCADPEAEPKIVANFAFTEPTLLKLRELLVPPPSKDCDPNVSTSCGGVDGWTDSNIIAHKYCATFGPSDGSTMPIIQTSTFNSLDHHKVYTLKQGLKGVCITCTSTK